MRPRLVFVHGIGGPRDAAAERETLLRALGDGARAAGHSRLAAKLLDGSGVDTRFAYYGDLFADPREAQGAAVQGQKDDETELLGALLLDAVDERLADVPDAHETRVLRRARVQLAPEGESQGTGNAVRQVLNAANTLMALPGLRRVGGWVSGAVMLHHLGQVKRYLAREEDEDGLGIDRRIRDRVARELDPDGATVVVAHSLGTVVTFETLHHHPGPVPLFVTLGSPMGMRTAVRPRMRPQPLRVPAAVGSWLNFWDRDDFIVGQPRLERCVAANDAAVLPVSRRVDSDGVWAHPAVKYLAQPGVAGPVAEAIEAAVAR
ncbi:alpha/beta hydrolase [Streptomyces parvus]|uniref:Alpha/beta hydrolase n=1 Tax=Streptomyces parvus TaxID=66428 RepID=A0A5D4JL99_9ACTN|nr:alpha/beta hydrolase [Streptomyces parvus]